MGTVQIPFSELFTDTVRTHGIEWSVKYYIRKLGMEHWEFKFWLKACWPAISA